LVVEWVVLVDFGWYVIRCGLRMIEEVVVDEMGNVEIGLSVEMVPEVESWIDFE